MYANINESFKIYSALHLWGCDLPARRRNVMEGSRQNLKDCFPSMRRGNKSYFLPLSSWPLSTIPRSISSPLKPLGEDFKIQVKMTVFEAAVPSVESPTRAGGSLQEKQFISGTAQGHR